MNKCDLNSRWINTEVEFTWDDELQQLIEVSSEGYCYDGDMAWLQCGPNQTYVDGQCVDNDTGTNPGTPDPPAFTYKHQPHSVQQAQYSYGYSVDENLIIPSIISYEEKEHGFISMVCRCEGDINDTDSCITQQETCVIWQVYDISDNDSEYYLPYSGTSYIQSPSNYAQYSDENIIDYVCSSEYNILMATDGGGYNWPTAATPCLTMSSNTCIKKNDLLIAIDYTDPAFGDINNWWGSGLTDAGSTEAVMYGYISDYWYGVMNGGGFQHPDETFDENENDISGTPKTCYDVFGGDSFSKGRYRMYYIDYHSNGWRISQPFKMISQSPIVTNISGAVDLPGWVAKYDFTNVDGGYPIIETSNYSTNTCEAMGAGGCGSTDGSCPPIGQYLQDNQRSMFIFDDNADESHPHSPLNPSIISMHTSIQHRTKGYIRGEYNNITSNADYYQGHMELSKTGQKTFEGGQIPDDLSDTGSYDFVQLASNGLGDSEWPYLKFGGSSGNCTHSSEDIIFVCCTEAEKFQTGNNTITIEAFDPQDQTMQVFINPTAEFTDLEGNLSVTDLYIYVGQIDGDGSIESTHYFSMPGTYKAKVKVEDSDMNQSEIKEYEFTLGGEVLGTLGCTDENACNPCDNECDIEDGSCIYQVQYYQDSDGDGTADNVGTVNEPVGVTCGEPVCQSLIEDGSIETPISTFFYIDENGNGQYDEGEIIVPESTTGAVEGTSECIPPVAGVDFPYDECTGSYDECVVCNGGGPTHACCDGTMVCDVSTCTHTLDNQDPQECCENTTETIICYCDEDGDFHYEGTSIEVGFPGGYCNPVCSDYAEYCYLVDDEYWGEAVDEDGIPYPETLGCTHTYACNYNPAATQDANNECIYPTGLNLYCETVYDNGDGNGGVTITYPDIELVGGYNGTDAELSFIFDSISYPFQDDFYVWESEQDFFNILNASYIPGDESGGFTEFDTTLLWYSGYQYPLRMRFVNNTWNVVEGTLIDFVNKKGFAIKFWVNKPGVIKWTLPEN